MQQTVAKADTMGVQSSCVGCRALFGDSKECITTLKAWQQMTNEARWVGRAMYDAEDMVLSAISKSIGML